MHKIPLPRLTKYEESPTLQNITLRLNQVDAAGSFDPNVTGICSATMQKIIKYF